MWPIISSISCFNYKLIWMIILDEAHGTTIRELHQQQEAKVLYILYADGM
jgi:hypothetical protein